ncbi:hypothetical protein DXU93_09535 [Brumimicrobium aurantiacum]|uniref:Uncharacterized protein n=1 Tax=Brumimicrobium aurantiacum TaxID=1737063 RepID=A0A3E1EXF7_9FLAO|nr:hypothetical protein DXU93_09535 [Brumimicrobium aurantiacum]
MLRIAVIKKKINSDLAGIGPRLNNPMNTSSLTQSTDKIKSSSSYFLKMITNFGSSKHTRNYVNSLIKLSEIEQLNDSEISLKIDKFIKLFSLFSRVWVIAMLSILLAFVFS